MITELNTLKNKELNEYVTEVMFMCSDNAKLAYTVMFELSLLPVKMKKEEIIELFKRWNLDTTDLRLHPNKRRCANEYLKDILIDHILHHTPHAKLKEVLLYKITEKETIAEDLKHFVNKELIVGNIFEAYHKLDLNARVVLMYYIRNKMNLTPLEKCYPEEYKTLKVFLNYVTMS